MKIDEIGIIGAIVCVILLIIGATRYIFFRDFIGGVLMLTGTLLAIPFAALASLDVKE